MTFSYVWVFETSSGGGGLNINSLKNIFESARSKRGSLEEELDKWLSDDSGLYAKIGFKVDKVEQGFAQLSFPFSQLATRRGGVIHGGVIMYALDNACGLAVMSANTGVDQFTLELKVNFLEPLIRGPFCVVGHLIRMGGTTAVAEGEVLDSERRLCAKGLGTWFIVRGKAN
jgi:uncharacterized protein (TIGR00369 family)